LRAIIQISNFCACGFHVETVSVNLIYSASEASKKKEKKECFEEHGNQFTKEYRNDVQNIGKYRKNRRFFRI